MNSKYRNNYRPDKPIEPPPDRVVPPITPTWPDGTPMRDSHGYQLHGRIATLKHDVPFQTYQGYWENGHPVMREYTVPAGAKVKVVMESRFGDVGITDNLAADYGYGARVDAIDTLNFAEEGNT